MRRNQECVHEKRERENIARRGSLKDGCLINEIFVAISGSLPSEFLARWMSDKHDICSGIWRLLFRNLV